MLVQGESFPYKHLTGRDMAKITNCCGGKPLDSSLVRYFLKLSGYPVLGAGPLVRFFNTVSRCNAHAAGLSSPEATRASNRGLLFYAGVVREISGATTIPFEDCVLRFIASTESATLATMSRSRIIAEADTFCALLEEFKSPLDLDDPDHFAMALTGAGTLHLAVTDSLTLMETATVLDVQHPELRAIEPLFDQLGK